MLGKGVHMLTIIDSDKTKNEDIFLKGKNLFFIGIGGISMSSLAMIALNEGANVCGSDRTCSSLTEKMERNGIKIFYSHSACNLPDTCDAVIYTAAIHSGNPELSEARKRGIPCFSRADFLGKIMLPYANRIGIAGTHGKSTTTSMTAMIALQANTNPTIVSGAELEAIDGAYKIGGRNYFIFEACEYTDSFLSFCPTTAVILNIELEHVDYFHSIEQITDSFKKYISKADTAVICTDSDPAVKAAGGFNGRLITYSIKTPVSPLKSDTHYFAAKITVRGEKIRFALVRVADNNRETLCVIDLNVPGVHNVSDAVAAAAACIENGMSVYSVKAGLQSFRGTKRRLEYRGTSVHGASVYDDYAHHPTEIKATLAAARSFGKTVWCIFQPHTYSRTYGLFDELKLSFGDADRLIITDIYSAGREENRSGVTSEQLADAIMGALYIPKGKQFEQISEYISQVTNEDDVVIVMGAGDIIALSSDLIEKAKKK